MRLPLAALESNASSDYLTVPCESEVFTHLKRWLKGQRPAVPADATATLLGCVRFAHMQLEFVEQHVNTDPIIASNPANCMIVAQAFQQALLSTAPPRWRRIGACLRIRIRYQRRAASH